MHTRFHRDIRIRDRRGEQFPHRAEKEGIAWGDGTTAAPGGEEVPQTLEDGVLQDGVYDEDEGGQNAGEEGGGTFFAEEGEEGAECGWGFGFLRGGWCGKVCVRG